MGEPQFLLTLVVMLVGVTLALGGLFGPKPKTLSEWDDFIKPWYLATPSPAQKRAGKTVCSYCRREFTLTKQCGCGANIQ